MNILSFLGGLLVGGIIFILLLLSEIRLPLSLAIGLLTTFVVGYGIIYFLYKIASDETIGWMIHHANDPLDLIINGGKDGKVYRPDDWVNPGREIQQGSIHDEGTGWITEVQPNPFEIDSDPLVTTTYVDPIERMELNIKKFWNTFPDLNQVMNQLLESKETFVFSIKGNILGANFVAELTTFMVDEMPWIKERVMHVYENYNGMNTQRLFVWNMVEPVVKLAKDLLLIQRESQLSFSALEPEDALLVLRNVRKSIKEAGDELNFDLVEKLHRGTVNRTKFEHVVERAIEKKTLSEGNLTMLDQRWELFDRELTSSEFSAYTIPEHPSGKAIWHPLIGLQLLHRTSLWKFVTLTKYTAEELSWKFINMSDATNGSDSFAEVFKETLRFYKEVKTNEVTDRRDSVIDQSSLLSMSHEKNTTRSGQLHLVKYDGATYQYDSRHLVHQMRGSYDGDKAAELLYIQFKNKSLQNNRYLLMIVDKSVKEVSCYVGDKVEQNILPVELISSL